MGMKSELRRRLSKTEGRLRREGRRLASVFLCGALIVGNLSAVPVSVLADDDNDYTYEIEKTALQTALQTAVSEGNTVSEELEFAGEHAEEYAELLEADGTLYELELSEEEIDEDDDRDKALDLRIFARIEGDIPVDEAYEIDGSEEIVFLLSNKTEKTATATISVDGLETDVITILPVDSIAVEEESTAVENAAVSTAVSGGVSVGGSGSGGSGGSAGSSAAKTEKVDSTEEDLVIEITESADSDVTEAEPIVEDSSVSILNEDDDESNISANVSDDTVSGQEEADEGSSDDKAEEDQTGDSETGDTGIENANSEDAADEDTNADDTEEAAGDTEGNDSEIGDTGSKEEADSSSDTSDADDTSDAGSGDDEGAGDASDNNSDSDITEDSDVSVLGSAISIHNSVLLAASIATDSDADEEASASDADNAVDGIVYESVRFDKKGAAAFATTATDLKLDEVDTTESTETVEYIAESDDVAVTVVAPVGALPDGAELSVTLYEEDSDEYTAAAEAINYNADEAAEAISDEETIETASEEITDDTSAGLAVLDISFYVDGEEVEPTEAVSVSIDASGILPEDADASTIEVQHLAETENGVEPTLVADITEETEGTVDEENAVVEFEVESFSSFTITWSYSTTGFRPQTYTGDITATAYLSGTSEEITEASGTIRATSGEEVGLTSDNKNLAIDGYELESAYINYEENSYEATSVTVTVVHTDGSFGQGASTTYTCTYIDNEGYVRTLYSGKGDQDATISLYYKTVPTVTIIAAKTNEGYLLTAVPSNFKNEDNIGYEWANSNVSGATLLDNGNGTAELTWTGDWSESTSDSTDSGDGGIETTIKVTATSSYTNEDGDTVTENAENSLTVSSVYVKVYVYVAAYDGNGNLFSDEMLALLGINKSTIDGNGYFPAGEIQLDVSFLSGKNYETQGAALITSASDWTELLTALSKMDTSTLIDMSRMTVDKSEYALDYSLNANNNVGDYISMAAQDVGYTWGSQRSALFRWNMSTSYGFEDQTVRYHLDLRFSTNTITFKYGNNSLTTDGEAVENRVYITGSTIQEMQESLEMPEGYKFAGFYEDADFSTPWDGVGTTIGEDITVYIRLVPINYVVINYKVAIGGGTVTSPDANNEQVQDGYETFDPDDSTYTVVGSTAEAADGYEFDGWYLNAECTQSVTVDWVKNEKIIPLDKWNAETTYIYYAKFVPANYDITLNKVDSADPNTALPDASFILARTDVNDATTYYHYDDENGVTWIDSVSEASAITTGENGQEIIHLLTTGYTYTLTETSAPDGYNLLTDSISFTVSGGIVTNISYGSAESSNVVTVSEDRKTITVTNTAGSALPETGGPGATPFRIAGLLLASCSAYLIYETLRRKRNYLR